MNIKKYIDYFKYIMEHKKNVFIECVNMAKGYKGKKKKELIFHAFSHDLSKFSPKEFFAYARYDFLNKENNTDEIKQDFVKAWEHHYNHNKHHWNYWIYKEYNMPVKYIRQMICDWKAMGRKFGDTAEIFYLKNYNKIQLSHNTRLSLEHQLDVIAPVAFTCECDEGYWMTLKELVEDSLKWEERNNQNSRWLRKEAIPWYKEKYDFDIFTLLKN